MEECQGMVGMVQEVLGEEQEVLGGALQVIRSLIVADSSAEG
jgi:hypothetical protein